jgi:uncharacterized protein (TIGR03435 family)
MRPNRTVLLVLALALAPALRAQAPAFEVTSVRPTVSGGESEIRPMPNGRFTATNATLRALVLRAYALHDSQLIAGPGWIATERFDIDARAAAPPADGPEALLPMVRTLLADRFSLRTRTETRTLPAYVLTWARRDRRLGPQIRPTQADCSGSTSPTEDQIRANALGGWPPCGMVYVVSYTMGGPEGVVKVRFRRSAVTIADFARTLVAAVDRPVVDRTGLDGRFDVEYSYSPRPGAGPAVDAVENVPPSLAAALDEQLGLKLESERTEVPMLVVESVERPRPN